MLVAMPKPRQWTDQVELVKDLKGCGWGLRGAGTIICTKLRQEYFKHEVRECSSSPDKSCAGVRRVLPFGTLSLLRPFLTHWCRELPSPVAHSWFSWLRSDSRPSHS